MIPLSYYLVLSASLFACGVTGFLMKRNIITIFMSIELMLNAVNLSSWPSPRTGMQLERASVRVLRHGGRGGGSSRRTGHHYCGIPYTRDFESRSRELAEAVAGKELLCRIGTYGWFRCCR